MPSIKGGGREMFTTNCLSQNGPIGISLKLPGM